MGIMIFVYALILGEISVRLMVDVPLLPRFVISAPYGVRMNMPNSSYWQTTPEIEVLMRINAQGMRADRDFTYYHAPDTCRVALFGDSIFVGFEVALEDSFGQVLERKINEAGFNAEVINMAVSGFGTAEMLIALQNEGLKYSPDIVIFQWHTTDPRNNSESRLFRVEAGRLTRDQQTFLPFMGVREWLLGFPLYRWVIQHSHLYTAMREKAARTVKRIVRSWRSLDQALDTYEAVSTAHLLTQGPPPGLDELLILEANSVAESIGATFILFDTPVALSRVQFASSLDSLPADLESKVRIISPLEDLYRASGPDTLLYREHGHGHFSELGNEVLAERAAAYLLLSGALADCAGANSTSR